MRVQPKGIREMGIAGRGGSERPGNERALVHHPGARGRWRKETEKGAETSAGRRRRHARLQDHRRKVRTARKKEPERGGREDPTGRLKGEGLTKIRLTSGHCRNKKRRGGQLIQGEIVASRSPRREARRRSRPRMLTSVARSDNERMHRKQRERGDERKWEGREKSTDTSLPLKALHFFSFTNLITATRIWRRESGTTERATKSGRTRPRAPHRRYFSAKESEGGKNKAGRAAGVRVPWRTTNSEKAQSSESPPLEKLRKTRQLVKTTKKKKRLSRGKQS